MKKYTFNTSYKKILGDTYTPVGIYFKIRDKFPNSILLESSDYHGDEHSMSYICCDPIASFQVLNNEILTSFPDGENQTIQITEREQVIAELTKFSQSFQTQKLDLPCITEGVFGYSSYNAVRYFEDIEINTFDKNDREIPDMIYFVYRHVIALNHFNNDLYIIDHYQDGQSEQIQLIEDYINKKEYATYNFNTIGTESSNFTDDEFLTILQKGIDHCQRGDVFQIVLSRRFNQQFEGDEFNVYRSLRSVNPSPYLFFFDFGNFKIFGSSPEAQIVVKNRKATIHPIAGTFKRTGNDSEDYRLSKKLFDDPKENSEHIMLVDLARNDLSRHGSQVTVESFKDIQFYSHVIHMVSKVTGQMDEGVSSLQLFADTFPAGTLSGAPKPMAMKLINKYEKGCRGYYGGAIGYLGFDGEFNHAIMIRTILSKNNHLYYQAGAGVVVKSSIQSELQEVNNKLLALKKAIERASKLNQ